MTNDLYPHIFTHFHQLFHFLMFFVFVIIYITIASMFSAVIQEVEFYFVVVKYFFFVYIFFFIVSYLCTFIFCTFLLKLLQSVGFCYLARSYQVILIKNHHLLHMFIDSIFTLLHLLFGHCHINYYSKYVLGY